MNICIKKELRNKILTLFILHLCLFSFLGKLGATQDTGKKTTTPSIEQQQKSSRCSLLRVSEKLPFATLNRHYSAQLKCSGGKSPILYSLAKGKFPEGLQLTSSGLITGIPLQEGLFKFTVIITDSCLPQKQIVKRKMNILVKPPDKATSVTTTPSHIDVTRGQTSNHEITYRFTDSVIPSQILTSPRGEFIAGSQVIGTINTELEARIRDGSGSVSESISISADLIELALNAGFTTFRYQRIFYTYIGSIAAIAQVEITIHGSNPLTVATTPDTFSVPDDQDSVLEILYSFYGESYVNTTLNSIEGKFYVDSNPIQTNSTVLTATIQNGTGSVNESLVVSYSLIQQILQMGAQTCEYSRLFTSPAGEISLWAVITIKIYTEMPPTFELEVFPSSFKIPRTQESQRQIQYAITCSNEENLTFTSKTGQFIAGDITVLDNAITLTMDLINGYGSLSEPLLISYDLIKKIEEMELVQFTYNRDFQSDTVDTVLHAKITFFLTTNLGAEVMIKSIELYFNNNKSEVTVSRNYSDLTAFANIAYIGSGLIEYKWLVDNRVIGIMSTHLPAGGSYTLSIPRIQPLPTFDTGTHLVKLDITRPKLVMPIPTLVYHVTTDEAPPQPGTLEITVPALNAVIPFQAHQFKWENNPNCSVYAITFSHEGDEIFSAMTKDNHYSIPQSILIEKFKSKTYYMWQVIGYDNNNKICAQSLPFRFSYEE